MDVRRVGVLFAVGALASVSIASCQPNQVRTLERVLPPAVEASCVLVRAFLNDGTAEEICATAEELAPFVPELLSARVERKESPSKHLVMAAALSAPARKLPRRRCVEWKTVGLAADGGKEASGGP